MRRLLIAVAALLLLVLGVLLLAPASLFDRWLREATEGRIALASAEGTLWSGSADLALALPSGRLVAIPGVRWQTSPWALLRGRVEGRLSSADDRSLRGRFRLGRDAVELLDVRVTVPADVLMLAAAVAALAPAGSMALEIGALRWSPPGSSGSGTLTWQQASVTSPPDNARIDLGTVRMRFEASGDHFAYSFLNEGGDVGPDGQGTWGPGVGPRGRARIRQNAGASAAVSASLARLGSPGADGSWALTFPVGAPPEDGPRR